MENIVSARRLRKSALKKNLSINFGDIGISENDIKRKIRQHEFEKEDNINSNNEGYESVTKGRFKIKHNFFIKGIISLNIVLVCIVCKFMFKEQLLENLYVRKIIEEYNKDYSKSMILEKIEEYAKFSYKAGKYIIPDKIVNYISSNYTPELKEYITNFELKREIFKVFNNNNSIVDETGTLSGDDAASDEKVNNEESDGIGGGEPYIESSLEEVTSAISTMDIDVNSILERNIDIKVPVKGTITSRFGAREQIFDNVNPYHTGIDIANKANTQIMSATDGVVVKTESMNKYYGNNVEIEKDGVIFKYAHLNKIEVKQGDIIKQNDVVGLMGSTGMSTGPHLHFEIKINNKVVDPEKILNFN